MRAVVTGGAGFIGSTLVDRLVAVGHQVDVIDDLSTGLLSNLAAARSDRAGSLRFHQADVRSGEVVALIARRRPDVVFHLAARRGASPADDAELDLVGSLRVAEGAIEAGASKLVYATDAAAVYGSVSTDALPVRESEPPAPTQAHGASKQAVIDHLRVLRASAGLEFTALLLATVYGPRDVGGWVAGLVRGVLGGRAMVATGGSADLVYVDDAVDAVVRAADLGDGLVVNVGSGIEVTSSAVVTLFAEQAGVPAPAVSLDATSSRLALNCARARIHLRWEPWTPLHEGLAAILHARPSG